MAIKSVMSHEFSQVPRANIPRSNFNRSCGYKTTFDAGYLVPVFVDEALPGDTFNLRMTSFSRLATPLHPFMDNLFMDTHFFAVPYRLVWDNWQKFNGEQKNPGDSTDYLVPTMTSTAVTGYLNGSLHDYLGLPTEVPGLVHSSLWHRAYNLIYNEWFRDENLQNSVVVDTDDGPDSPTDYVLLRRGKRHDYFTSCLPWPQKVNDGSSLNVPLGGTAPVKGIGVRSTYANFPYTYPVIETGGATVTYTFAKETSIPNEVYIKGNAATGGVPQIYADLSSATGITINQLRQAFQIQRMFE